MCDPLTIAAAAVTIGGQVTQGVGASRQASYQAAIAKQNRAYSIEKSRDAITRGEDELKVYQRKAGQTMGEQRASMAANGIELGYGSPVDVMGDAAVNAEEDSRNIVGNYQRERQGYLIDASTYLAQRQAAKAAKRGAIISTAFNVMGTALGAASQVGKLSPRPRPPGM